MQLLKRITVLTSLAIATIPVFAEEVNVYSARKEALIKPVLDQFTDQTGIKVNLVTGKADALISRLSSEGKYSPADVLITTDVGRLHRAKEQSLLQPYDSEILKAAVPQRLRDDDAHWYALTVRARTIVFHPDRVSLSELNTLEGLAEEQWRGRICIRSSGNIYNQSMIAAMLAQVDEKNVQNWVNDFVKNFARPPKGGDRDQIKAVVAGQCDLAIANTYYLAGMLNDSNSNNVDIAKQVKVFWPNQDDRGTHINISGAAITKSAPNLSNAQKLMDFMVNADVQRWYAETNNEYPVLEGVELSTVLKDFGEFKHENIPLHKLGQYNATAVKVMDKAGWK